MYNSVSAKWLRRLARYNVCDGVTIKRKNMLREVFTIIGKSMVETGRYKMQAKTTFVDFIKRTSREFYIDKMIGAMRKFIKQISFI